MDSKSLKRELSDLLYDSCVNYLEQFSSDFNTEKVYAFCIFCSDACRNIALAISTRESLARRKNKGVGNEPENFYEVNASEWEYVNKHYELFDKVDELIDSLYNEFYDGELDDVDLDQFDDDQLWEFISNFFNEVIVRTLKRLKESGVLDDETFEKDVLLGIQFGDPDESGVKMIENVSSQVNSEYWHCKIKDNCDYLLSLS
ncbi:DUF4303 domain-containing protein [Pleionea sp. CnH1-48]|uniref:DUF4303 domain-containing protein n=1 Tax=Pleionea sp. CnH1-48 TaxID=2954494 RepID=UPI0020982A4B|nr:DUF4303 domain-containing protein [Pleionea sp. CnH1-48]MCO7227579.1 DUF4303 domain-containing protein [Pleionea sp. CnH1-48]